MLDLNAIARLTATTQALVDRCAASSLPPYDVLEAGLGALSGLPYWTASEIQQVRIAAQLQIKQRLHID
jgi:hypothetical protein